MGSKKEVGAYIRNKRKALALTQEDLTQRLSSYGVKFAASTIAWWETGRGLPPLNDPVFIEALANSLELSITELLNGLGIVLPGGDMTSEDLSPVERELLSAFRSGDFQKMMRIASEKPVTRKE